MTTSQFSPEFLAALSTDETRPHLSAVSLWPDFAAATDGHRLHIDRLCRTNAGALFDRPRPDGCSPPPIPSMLSTTPQTNCAPIDYALIADLDYLLTAHPKSNIYVLLGKGDVWVTAPLSGAASKRLEKIKARPGVKGYATISGAVPAVPGAPAIQANYLRDALVWSGQCKAETMFWGADSREPLTFNDGAGQIVAVTMPVRV